MNGLEAIELMKQGGMVATYGYSEGGMIFKIENNKIKYKRMSNLDRDFVVDRAFDVTLPYEEYIEPKKLTGWERVKRGEYYYIVNTNSVVIGDEEAFICVDNKAYEKANYFSSKEKAEEINFKQTLFRKLQRFSDENGGNEIDWDNIRVSKFTIRYDYAFNSLSVCLAKELIGVGQVYFISHEVAEKAIELFKEDLIKYFTYYK